MQVGEPQLPDGIVLGEVFAAKYRLDAVLGWGAMGIVVAAHHLLLDRAVAIKFLLAASERYAKTRFLREARAAGSLRSEHVVRVLDVDVHESGVPYIVMERLSGSDLAASLRTSGPFPVEIAVDHLLEACEAIAEAHGLQIVHRDLKPANLFLARRDGAAPIIKVLDFGIAKSPSLVSKTIDWRDTSSGAVITQERAILGSPFYMSPEQMESSGEVDARTDIWALGVTLFELATGKPPYTGTSLVQVYSRITAQGEPAWRSEATSLPAGLQAVLERCLKRDRAARHANVGELAAALAPFGSPRSRDSEARIRTALAHPRLERDTVNVATPRPVTSSSTGDQAKRSRLSAARARARWTARAVGLLAVVAFAGVLAIRRSNAPVGQRPREVHASEGLTATDVGPSATALAPPPSSASAEPPAPAQSTSSASLFTFTHLRPHPSPTSVTPAPSAPPHPSATAPEPSTQAAPAPVTDGGFDAKKLLEQRE